jgi:predicted AAA+ superfamily ATPase
MNLESMDFAAEAADAAALHAAVVSRLAPTGVNYVFLDEVQTVPQFQKAIDSLHLRDDIDLYVTGSNANLLSGELATLLSGRYIEIPLAPFSFREYISGRSAELSAITPERAYAEFSSSGGFPFVSRLLPDLGGVSDYLDGVLNTVLLKDVMVRQRASNPAMLHDVTRFLMSNVGSPTSLRRVANTLGSAGRAPSPNTVESYLTGLVDAFIIYPLRPVEATGLRHLDTPSKYYCVDLGLRSAVLGWRGGDVGHVLENVVFLELRRRCRNLWFGRSGGGEIDFVAQDDDATTYIQVAATVRDEATLARELAPLKALNNHHPKLLLTLDQDPPASHDGIQQRYVLDWLLGD